tara:strand:- start:1666 stop:2280 length:615 start_codon:yes stop_codon:yes gene_type:complete
MIQIVFITPALCQDSKIIIRLSGDINYPGDLSVLNKTIKLKKVCFLGIDAKGKIDKEFLKLISIKGIPEGNYKVTPPSPDEKWPVDRFVKNGALRLKIISGTGLGILNASDKKGIVIHGRDFYPILDKILKNKTMINFYNDQLFEGLKNNWGPLRISNWDMGRLADSWIKMNRATINWDVRVVKVIPREIKSFCKPPVTKRTPD